MHLSQLVVNDFRSYGSAELSLVPGVTVLLGLNGQGKTNLVEAAGYLASLSSHRVATDAALVRHGSAQAVVRGMVERDGRQTLLELEINPGRANRARLNRSPVPRPREILGVLRTVLFAPEDLALVKGDPADRRRFLDELLVSRQPRYAAVRGDYDRVLKQRNALLKSAAPALRRVTGARARTAAPGGQDGPSGSSGSSGSAPADALRTLEIWDAQLAQVGAALLYARLRLLRDLTPYLVQAYQQLSASTSAVGATYRSSLDEPASLAIGAGEVPSIEALHDLILGSLALVRTQELDRGITLVGPHRDDVLLRLGELPAKGYASHGESWSLALALRLAAFELLRHDLGTDPVLILDDVFAELDVGRRERLAARVVQAEQVLVTAAVPQDVPDILTGGGATTYHVNSGEVARVD